MNKLNPNRRNATFPRPSPYRTVYDFSSCYLFSIFQLQRHDSFYTINMMMMIMKIIIIIVNIPPKGLQNIVEGNMSPSSPFVNMCHSIMACKSCHRNVIYVINIWLLVEMKGTVDSFNEFNSNDTTKNKIVYWYRGKNNYCIFI